ncbi:MAG: efflux RND transporter periplasmic adaptor subunit [Deltaproteobacteria bacterium]|nr:MAG: efflux RND transporter periplasmic adaptor subunit [Deltaproteobacteria bacterium]
MSDAAPQVTGPAATQPIRRRGSWLVRAIIGAAVVAVVVWFLRSRHQEPSASDGAAAGPGAQSEGRRGGDAGGAEGRVVPVQVAPAERKDLPIWLEGLGTVAAVQQVTVRPQVDGRIDKVLFVEGQPVKRGDVLVQIDPRPFLVALHQAQGALARDKAQLETNQANLKRYEGLKAQNLVAGQQVEEIAGQVGQFEGAVKIDQAQIENAQLQLDYAQVKAPIDGITGVRQVDAGNIVHQSDPNGLVVITQIDPAAVFFTLPQDQLASVAQALARGDVPVEAYSRDQPGHRHAAAQGADAQPRPRAVAQRVRQGAHAGRDPQGRDRDPAGRDPARAAGRVRLRRRSGQHGADEADHDRAHHRRRRGGRQGPVRR